MNRLVLALVVVSIGDFASGQEAAKRHTGPWDVEALLASRPAATWGTTDGLITPVYYEGEPRDGKPTRVFAYYAKPEGDGPFPAMLLVHGGGGKAFREWAELWARRGYVALAMDLAGHGPDGQRLPDGGPDQDDEGKFGKFTDDQVRTMWTYHAVAAVIRGHALLASRPEVDADRIGVTGISWGGYLTCIVSGIDPKLKVAVPVYGCGFLDRDSAWIPRFEAMSTEQRDRWIRLFDPSNYLPGVSCPILFVNGTNDFAYPMGSYRASYRLVQSPRTLCVTVNMPHGHAEGWAPREIGLFVDSVLKSGSPLATLGPVTLTGDTLEAKVKARAGITGAKVHTTSDTGPWQKRSWTTADATLNNGLIQGTVPKSATAAFLTVVDERGAIVSTEHVEIPETSRP